MFPLRPYLYYPCKECEEMKKNIERLNRVDESIVRIINKRLKR